MKYTMKELAKHHKLLIVCHFLLTMTYFSFFFHVANNMVDNHNVAHPLSYRLHESAPNPTVRVIAAGARGSLRNIQCNVGCKWTDVPNSPIHEFSILVKDNIYDLLSSMEQPSFHPSLRKGVADGLSTISFQSDVPVVYIDNIYSIQTLPIQMNNVIQGASFIAQNCQSQNGREKWV